MALPAVELGYTQGVSQPLRLTEGITQGELARTLRDASKEAHSLVAQNMLRGNVGGRVRAAQLRAASQGLGSLSSSLWGKVGAQTRAGIYSASTLAADHAIDRDYLIGMPFKAIQQYADGVYFSAYQSAEDIISRHTNGFTLADRIYRNGKATTLQVGNIIDRGLAQQLSAREIAAKVRAHFDPAVPGGTSYAAMRLARTEINNAHHDTTIALTKDQPWVLGYEWHLSGSHPKPDPCDQFASRDFGMGQGVYPKNEVPSKPHPQCLCFITMVQPSRKDFTDNLVKGRYDDHLREMGCHC